MKDEPTLTVNIPELVYPPTLTKREWFAGFIAQGISARGPIDGEADSSISGIVKHCVLVADALVKELEQE